MYNATEFIALPTDLPEGGAPFSRARATARGAVTQGTNISTAVVCNSLWGTITTVDPALAAAGEAEFSVTNDKVEIGDVVVISIQSGPADNEHVIAFVSSVSNGSFTIALSNLAAANQADGAMVINFMVFKNPFGGRFV